MLSHWQDKLRALLPAEMQLDRARTLSRAGRAAEALAIWTRLADAGVPRAQTNLGACYATGSGVPVDVELAQRWLQRGAEAGDRLGQRNLGTLLLTRDPAAAASWYRRAAEAGDAESQDQWSLMLLSGTGIPQDAAAARQWAEAAARQGITEAAARFATMCHDAVGGARDPSQAAHWWRVAARAGHADSAARLGAALHMGQGTPEDQVEATAWLLVASGRQSTLVRPFLGRVREALSPAQLAQAEDIARGLGWTEAGRQR